jgi:hypothetical protein
MVLLNSDGSTRVRFSYISLYKGTKMKPLKKSDIDGLCGMFSVINAIRYLYPDCLGDQEDKRTQEFVLDIVKHIESKQFNAFSNIWLDGCERSNILDMLNFVNNSGFDIELSSLASMIKLTNECDFWQDARTLLDDQSIIIAGFEDPDPHWTCIKKIGDKCLYHFDSSVYTRTNIDDTDTIHDGDDDWYFRRKDIFLIRRK